VFFNRKATLEPLYKIDEQERLKKSLDKSEE
jgi:hypothetical protein